MFSDEFRVPQWLRLVAGTIVGMVLSGRLTQIMLSLVAGIALGAVGMWLVQRWTPSVRRRLASRRPALPPRRTPLVVRKLAQHGPPAGRHRRPARLPDLLVR